MTNNILTLDSLREDVKSVYASVDIQLENGLLVLRNPLTMSKAERKKLSELQKSLSRRGKSPVINDKQGEDESDEDYEARLDAEVAAAEEFSDQTEDATKDTVRKIIRLVANDQELAKALLAAIGDDMATLLIVLRKYIEGTQAGEA